MPSTSCGASPSSAASGARCAQAGRQVTWESVGGNRKIEAQNELARQGHQPLHLIRGIVFDPPVGSRLDEVTPPGLVPHVPLSGEDVVVVATPGEIALLPLAAVGEGDVLLAEGHQRVRRREVADDRVRVLRGITDDVGHQRALPPVVDVLMARRALLRSDEALLRAGGRFSSTAGDDGECGDKEGDPRSHCPNSIWPPRIR